MHLTLLQKIGICSFLLIYWHKIASLFFLILSKYAQLSYFSIEHINQSSVNTSGMVIDFLKQT